MADILARTRNIIGTTAEWQADNLILGLGEIAIENKGSGVRELRIGTGVDAFFDCPVITSGATAAFDDSALVLLDGSRTMTGPLVLPAQNLTTLEPADNEAATGKYIRDYVAANSGGGGSYVNLDGTSTMTGPLKGNLGDLVANEILFDVKYDYGGLKIETGGEGGINILGFIDIDTPAYYSILSSDPYNGSIFYGASDVVCFRTDGADLLVEGEVRTGSGTMKAQAAGVGGVSILVDGTTGQVSIDQTQTTGNSEQTWIEMDRNGGVKLLFADAVKLETTSAGGTLSGTWTGTVTSDANLKTNIEPLDGLTNIRRLMPVSWDWKSANYETEAPQGFTAQNWAQVYPEDVTDKGDHLAIDYAFGSLKYFADLVSALLSLDAKVEQLETQLANRG